MPRLTITEIAKQVGVHKSTVSRQVGKLELAGEDGLVDLDEYIAARAGLDPALQTTGRAKPAAAQATGMAAARHRKMEAEAERAELDLAQRRGELIERSLVAATLGPALRRLRDDLLAVPRDNLTDPAQADKCEAAIGAVLERASLEILSDGGASPPA